VIADFIVGYFKWAFNVVIKLFFVVIVALLIVSVGTFALGVDANAIFVDPFNENVITSGLQHRIPHIVMFAEGIMQLFKAAGTNVSIMETTIYDEILFCCIYMIIVRCFDTTIQGFTRIIRRFMSMGKITTMFADATVYIASYALAVGIAISLFDGIVKRIPANIACWIMAGSLLAISVILLMLRRKTILASFLDLVGGGLLDILQLVLIYFATMCIAILNSTNAVYLTGNEQLVLTVFAFVSLAVLALSFIKRLISDMT